MRNSLVLNIVISFVIIIVLIDNQQLYANGALDLVCQIIRGNGYPCESHQILTMDGYWLTVHRIPSSSSATTTNKSKQYLGNDNTTIRNQINSDPFILMHGIIGSAADFALPGRNRALASVLHDNNYDVWLPSARGTTWSKRHRDLDSSSPEFWNFSWHEIGIYDIPAIIDYVLNNTGASRLHYVGHSQGSAVCLVMLAEKPEYNDKLRSATFLSPVSFLSNIESPPLRILAYKMGEIELLLNKLNLNELAPSTALNQLGGHLLCSPNVPTQNLCILTTYLVVGFSDFEIDGYILPKILETTPAGISAKQAIHFAQIIQSGKFQQFDYGSKQKNYNKYRRKTPPEYNLRNIRVPVHLFSGSKDSIMVKQDIITLASQLKNTKFTLNEIRGFNHIDFLYSTEANRLIYKRILANTKSYSNSKYNLQTELANGPTTESPYI